MRLLAIILITLQQFTLPAQNGSLEFIHFTKSSGLNQSSVNTIFQDHEDMLWIGNFGGINAFDGYQFTSYENDFYDSTTVSDNSIWKIYEDRENNLWFGTKASLSRFNRAANNFENYYVLNNDPESPTLAVKAIFECQNGDFLVGTEGKGLFIFDRLSKEFKPVPDFPDYLKITDIQEDAQLRLWVATEGDGLYVKEGQQVTQYLRGRIIWDLEATKNRMWAGTDTQGTIRFETAGDINQSAPDSRFGASIKVIKQDREGNIWLGSGTMGLSVLNPNSNEIHRYQHNNLAPQSIADNDISDIVIGANGVVYIGFYMKGFDKVLSSPFFKIQHNPLDKNSLSHNNAYVTYMDPEDRLWIGTFGGGLNILDTKTSNFEIFRHDQTDKQSISHDWVRIFLHDNDQMWIGTWGGGLNLMDIQKKTFKRYLADADDANSISMNIVTALYRDSHNTLWIGTYGEGINIYDEENDHFTSLKHQPDNPNSLSDNHITSFLEDSTGLWICTYGGGINRYNYESKQFERFLPEKNNPYSLNNHKVLHMYPAGDDSYWVTTLGGGLNRFYPAEKKFHHYTTKDGLSNSSTMGMLRTEDGKYWISSNMGLNLFDPENESFKVFTMKDGLASDDYNLEAYSMDSRGNFYFGGKNGITIFHPDEVKESQTFPALRVQQVHAGNEIYRNTTNSEASFPYGKRVSFDFCAINPSRTANIQYAYLLEGLNDDWQYIDDQRHLEFNALQPGNYTLKIKSTNSSKVWNPSFIAYRFSIPPPWYRTWWFRVSVVVALFLVGFIIYRRRVNQLQWQNKMLEDKVAERTETIVQKNNALEEAFDKLKQLESFKESMVHMIAHDLKNPLVSIINRSDNSGSDLEGIKRSGYSMLQLIENMLDIQKFQNTEVPLKTTHTNLCALANNAIQELEGLATEKNINIYNNIDGNAAVLVDSSFIERVLGNLLSNAIKYTPPQGKITLWIESDDSNMITVHIEDNGDGIPAEKLSAIFEQYGQVNAKSLGAAGSTGLGLSFCKLAIEQHHGKIWVTSEEGKGSTFSFTLPISNLEIKTETGTTITQESKELSFTNTDIEFLSRYYDKIQSLDVYSTGEWYELLDILNAEGSETIKDLSEKIKSLLSHYDETGLESIKQEINQVLVTK